MSSKKNIYFENINLIDINNHCVGCLKKHDSYINYTCGHKCCDSCSFLNILMNYLNNKNISDNEVKESNHLIHKLLYNQKNNDLNTENNNNAQPLLCLICNKGYSKYTKSEFISKVLALGEVDIISNKCDGCFDNDKNNIEINSIKNSQNYDCIRKNSIKDNFSIKRNKNVYCIQCDIFMCNTCQSIHSSIKAFDNHILSYKPSISKISALYCKCGLNNLIKFNCTSCNMKICSKCMLLDHLNHKYEYIIINDEYIANILEESLNFCRKNKSINNNKNVNNSELKNNVKIKRQSVIISNKNENNPVKKRSNSIFYNFDKSSIKDDKVNEIVPVNTQHLVCKKFKSRLSQISCETSLNKSPKNKININNKINTEKLNIFINKIISSIDINSSCFSSNIKIKEEENICIDEDKVNSLTNKDKQEEILNNTKNDKINQKTIFASNEDKLLLENSPIKINVINSKYNNNSNIKDDEVFSRRISVNGKINNCEDQNNFNYIKPRNSVFNNNYLSTQLKESENEFNSKLISSVNNLNNNARLVLNLIKNIDYIISKKSIKLLNKLIVNFKDLKHYLKIILYFFKNEDLFYIVQYKLFEFILNKCIFDLNVKEELLFNLIIKNILSTSKTKAIHKNSYISETLNRTLSHQSRYSARKSLNNNKIKIAFSKLINNNVSNIKNLESTIVYSSSRMSTFSMPNVFSIIYTSDKILFIFWINSLNNIIDYLKIYYVDTFDNSFSKSSTNSNESKSSNNNNNNNNTKRTNKSNYLKEEKRELLSLKGHKGFINSIRVFEKILSNDHYLVSCCSEGIVKIWKLEDNNIVLYKNFVLKYINILSSYLIIPNKDNNLIIQEDKSKDNNIINNTSENKIYKYNQSSLYPTLIISSYSKNYPIQVYDTSNGKLINELKAEGRCFFIEYINLDEENSKINYYKVKRMLFASTLNKKGYILSIFNYSNLIKLFDIKLDTYVNSLFYYEELNKSSIIINDRNGYIKKISLNTGDVLHTTSHKGYYNICKWDNNYFISCGKTTLIEVLSSKDFSSITKYEEAHKDSVRSLLVAPYPGKGICLFSYGEDNVIKCWSSIH